MSMCQAIVYRKTKSRRGKGFSLVELKEAGLGLREAFKEGISIDPRRSTKHEENVKTLRMHLGEMSKASSPTPMTEAIPEKLSRAEVATPKVTIELTEVKGIGQKLAEKLKQAGIKDTKELAASSPEKVAKAIGISEKKASILIENAGSPTKEL